MFALLALTAALLFRSEVDTAQDSGPRLARNAINSFNRAPAASGRVHVAPQAPAFVRNMIGRSFRIRQQYAGFRRMANRTKQIGGTWVNWKNVGWDSVLAPGARAFMNVGPGHGKAAQLGLRVARVGFSFMTGMFTPGTYRSIYNRHAGRKLKTFAKFNKQLLERYVGKGVVRWTLRAIWAAFTLNFVGAMADSFRDVVDVQHYGADCGRLLVVLCMHVLQTSMGPLGVTAMWDTEEMPLPKWADTKQRGHEQFLKEALRDFERRWITKNPTAIGFKETVNEKYQQFSAKMGPKAEMINQLFEQAEEFAQENSWDDMQESANKVLYVDPGTLADSVDKFGNGDGKLDFEDVKYLINRPFDWAIGMAQEYDPSPEHDTTNEEYDKRDELATPAEYAALMREKGAMAAIPALAADLFNKYARENEDLCAADEGYVEEYEAEDAKLAQENPEKWGYLGDDLAAQNPEKWGHLASGDNVMKLE